MCLPLLLLLQVQLSFGLRFQGLHLRLVLLGDRLAVTRAIDPLGSSGFGEGAGLDQVLHLRQLAVRLFHGGLADLGVEAEDVAVGVGLQDEAVALVRADLGWGGVELVVEWRR